MTCSPFARRHRPCLAALALTALLGGTPAVATELRIAAQAGADPKFVADPATGAVGGICVDILRAIERIDPDLHFSGEQNWLPLTRMYSAMEHGMLDALCGLSHLPDRDKKYRFVGPPLFSVRYHLVARADDPVVINGWDDVRKLGRDGVVLANRGFGGVALLENAGVRWLDASAASPELNVQKLLAHRGRFFFHRNPGLQTLLDRSGQAPKLRILPNVMVLSPLYFVVSKHVAVDVADRLGLALQALDKSGELAAIARKWE